MVDRDSSLGPWVFSRGVGRVVVKARPHTECAIWLTILRDTCMLILMLISYMISANTFLNVLILLVNGLSLGWNIWNKVLNFFLVFQVTRAARLRLVSEPLKLARSPRALKYLPRSHHLFASISNPIVGVISTHPLKLQNPSPLSIARNLPLPILLNSLAVGTVVY